MLIFCPLLLRAISCPSSLTQKPCLLPASVELSQELASLLVCKQSEISALSQVLTLLCLNRSFKMLSWKSFIYLLFLSAGCHGGNRGEAAVGKENTRCQREEKGAQQVVRKEEGDGRGRGRLAEALRANSIHFMVAPECG